MKILLVMKEIDGILVEIIFWGNQYLHGVDEQKHQMWDKKQMLLFLTKELGKWDINPVGSISKLQNMSNDTFCKRNIFFK